MYFFFYTTFVIETLAVSTKVRPPRVQEHEVVWTT